MSRTGSPARWRWKQGTRRSWAGPRGVEQLLAQAEALARRVGQPHAIGLVRLASGTAACAQGRWRKAVELSDEATEIFRSRCTGTAWELDCAEGLAATGLFHMGEAAELARRLPVLRSQARQRGNLLALTAPSTINLPELAADDVDAAERCLQQAMRHWPSDRFFVQHLSALYFQVQTDLYRGDPEATWRRIHQQRSKIARSLLLRIQLSRTFTYQTRARCALAAAEKATDPRPMLRLAERDARRVERERLAWTQPLAELIRAAVATFRGETPKAVALLEKAIEHFESADMMLYASAARRRLGQLKGGPAGGELVAAADASMTRQNIVNPARMTAAFAPGFPQELPWTNRASTRA